MRPRESARNDEILKNLSNSITKISIDHPEDTILVCGDLNREDALAEVYLEPLVEKIKLEPNHLTKTETLKTGQLYQPSSITNRPTFSTSKNRSNYQTTISPRSNSRASVSSKSIYQRFPIGKRPKPYRSPF